LLTASSVAQTQDYSYDYSKQATLKPLLEVLDRAKVSASLEFSGSCESFDSRHFPDFPKLRAPENSAGNVLQTVRGMLADDPSIRVTQESNGTIRMIEDGVPTDFLTLKIEHISFDSKPWDAAALNGATAAVMHSPEAMAFRKTHDMEELGGAAGSFIMHEPGSTPPAWLPRLPNSINGLLVTEVMDLALRTFPGIWIYQDCPKADTKKRYIYLRSYRLQGGRVQ
jgi:hypothetical protein